MGLRPHAAHWFEVLVAREDLPLAAEALARTGAVEVECSARMPRRSPENGAHSSIERFDRLAGGYAPHWPEPDARAVTGTPAALLERAVARIEAWERDAHPVLAKREELEREVASLALMRALIDAGGEELFDLEPTAPAGPLGLIDQQRDRVETERAALHAELASLTARHDLAGALGIAERIRWYLTSAPPHTRHFARITGWTDDPTGDRLSAALAAAHVAAVLDLPTRPPDRTPPATLDEVDPPSIVGFLAPLLFGYMFADVGQGLVLLIAGLWLGRRRPALKLLVPGGAASIAFGLLFGTVFGREDWLPALWLHPMEDPLMVLATSLVGGAVLLAIGLVLRGMGRRFVSTVDRSERPLSSAFAVLGEIVERVAQLALDTVSFARVGAFALAHAGLSAAISTLSDTAPNLWLSVAVGVAGNALVIVLEGLAVSIETTRLVLFEFFDRFGAHRGARATSRPRCARESRIGTSWASSGASPTDARS